jgi:CAAX protease family protein
MSVDEHSYLPAEPPEPEPHSSEPPPSGSPAPVHLQDSSRWFPPEDFRVPWNWVDVALIVPFAIGAMFLIALLILGGLALFRLTPSHLRRSMSELSFILISAQILMEIALLGYFALQIRARTHLPFWRTIGWRPLRLGTLTRGLSFVSLIVGGVALALFTSLASAAFPPKHPLPIERIFQTRSLTILFMATAVLVAPVVEETLFRGYLYPVAARSFGIVGGIVFTGTLFGLLHGSQLWGGWWQIALLVVVGIIFTYVRAITRTVWSSFLLHVSYNSVQVIAVLVTLFAPHHFVRLE